MKSIRSLVLIAIGMMVFTVTATTAKPEQKQKAELVKELSLPAYEVNVVNEIKVVSVVLDAQTKSKEAQTFKKVNDPQTFYAIIKDVGWRSQKGNTTKIAYKEKYLDKYNKEKAILIHKGNIQIRDNC